MAPTPAKGVTPKHRHSPTYKQIVAAWLLGPTMQGAAQLVVGAFIVALFSFVRAMNFPLACTAMTLFLVMSVLVAQDLHFGSKLLGSCLVVGSGATGAVLGGCVASIAKSIDYNPYTGHDQNDFYAYTAVYMCLGAFFLAILVINRVGQDPPYLWAVGMISCLSFGIVLNNGQFIPAQVPPAVDTFGNQIQYFWRQVVGRVLLDFVIAQGTAVFTALLILPTYANVELRGNVAKALAGIGNSVSKYASKALEPDDPKSLYACPISKRMPSSTASSTDSSASKLGPVRTTYDDDNSTLPATGKDALGALRSADLDAILGEVIIEDQEEDDETVLKHLRLLSGPAMAGDMPAAPPPVSAVLKLGPPVASYRALLGRARALMPFAMIEPPFITRYVFHSDAWGRVMGACETLLTRVAGLEVVVEERRQVLGEATMECYFTVSVVPNLRLVFAEVAATCATLSRSLDTNSPSKGPRPVGGCMAMFGRSWHDTRTQLKEVMGESVRGYLRRVHLDLKAQEAGAKVHILDSTRMRAIMYTFSLTLGIIDAMEDLEKAVYGLVIKTGGPRAARLAALVPKPPAGAVAEAAEKTAEETAQAKGDVEMGSGDTKPDSKPTIPGEAAPTTAVSEPVPKAAAPPASGGHPPPQILWLLMAITLELGAPLWQGLIKWAKQDAPSVFKPGGFKAALKSRNFQVYIKYYAVLVLVMMLIQGLAARQDTVAARTYRPGIAFNAAVLSMSEKVEATVSKACLWIVGTVVGGTLGYAIMVSPEVATNPYALMAIVCAFTFIVGASAGHQYKVLIVLSLMCFNDIVLCQYTAFPKGCTDCTGADTTYGARVLAVLLGALVPLIICNTVLPWYNSQWCLEVMGQVFVQTHAVINAAYDKYYQEGQQAFGLSKRTPSTPVPTVSIEGKDPKLSVQVNADGNGDEQEGGKNDSNEGLGQGQGGPEGSNGSGTVQEPTVVGFPTGPALSVLQARIAGPLVGVQIALVKDAATWQRGLLATPPIVPRLLQQHFALLDRVAAVTVMLRPATITGTFSGSAFKNIVTGLHDQFKAVLDELGVIVRCSNRLMSGDVSAEAKEALRVAVGVLESERLKTRAMVINHRRQFHRALACEDVDNLPYANDPDDLVRVLSFIHAYIKLLDKAVQIAGMVYGLEERSSWAKIFGSSWLQ